MDFCGTKEASLHNSFDQRHSCRTRNCRIRCHTYLGGGAGELALNCGGSPLRPGIAGPRQVPIAVGTMGIPTKHKARREP